jgi:hypothetical protein
VRGRSSERALTGWNAHLNEIPPGRNADPTGPDSHLSRPATRDARHSPCSFASSVGGWQAGSTMEDRRDVYYAGVPVSSRSI